jgi:hypothetical protein
MLALDLRSGYVLSRPGSSAVRCWYREGRRALAAGADSFRPSGPAPRFDAGPFSVLRQDVAERREDHPVYSAGLSARARARRSAHARPGIAGHVGVLHAVLELAPGPVVEAVPEAECALDQRPRVGGAIGESPRLEPGGSVWG